MNDLTWIYVATNPSFPKYVKVGWTRHNPHKRISEIDSTGVPTPFDLNYVACVGDAAKLEKLTHQFLDNHRVRSSREFFEVSAKFASEAIRSVAIGSGIVFYFEKIYLEDGVVVSRVKNRNFQTQTDEGFNPTNGEIYKLLGDIDSDIVNIKAGLFFNSVLKSENGEYDLCEVYDAMDSYYARLLVKAFHDLDFAKCLSTLLEYSRRMGVIPIFDDIFGNEEISQYMDALLRRSEADPSFSGFAVSDCFVDDFVKLAVDEFCVQSLIDWLELLMISDAQQLRVAQYYIAQGETSKVRLLGANYLYEVGGDRAEILSVYLSELKIDSALIRQPTEFISFNQIINQAFVRMCDILIKTNCHDYDDFLSRFLDFLASFQTSFDRKYTGLRTVLHCYFDGGDFDGCAPLNKYIVCMAGFECQL